MIRVVALAGAVLAFGVALAAAAPPPTGRQHGRECGTRANHGPRPEDGVARRADLAHERERRCAVLPVSRRRLHRQHRAFARARVSADGRGRDGAGGRGGGRAHALRRRAHRCPGGGFDHCRSQSAIGRIRRVRVRSARATSTRAGRSDVAGLDGLARGLGSRLGPVGAERQPSRGPARCAGRGGGAPRHTDCGPRRASGGERASHRQRAGDCRGSGTCATSPARSADAPPEPADSTRSSHCTRAEHRRSGARRPSSRLTGGDGKAFGRRLCVPDLRDSLVRGQLRRPTTRDPRRLASRRGHLRPRRRTSPRCRRRRHPHGGLHQARWLPALAA